MSLLIIMAFGFCGNKFIYLLALYPWLFNSIAMIM